MAIPVHERCIVNDAHGSQRDQCGHRAAKDRPCLPPVCANHLCQHRRPDGHRCKGLPVRLDKGDIMARGGWFPQMSRSANCEHHERYNCVVLMNGSVRCSGARASGSPYCSGHAALMCQWRKRGGRGCAEIAYPGSHYCTVHCCAVENEEGYRCPEPRTRDNSTSTSSIYCKGHCCTWRNCDGQRCAATSFPGTHGACVSHTCVREGCDKRAENNASRCEDHLCAFGLREPGGGRAEAVPICYREPVEAGAFCEFHAEYKAVWERVVEDRRAGGGLGS